MKLHWNFNEFNIEFFELWNFLSPEKSNLAKSIWWAKSLNFLFLINLDLQEEFLKIKFSLYLEVNLSQNKIGLSLSNNPSAR